MSEEEVDTSPAKDENEFKKKHELEEIKNKKTEFQKNMEMRGFAPHGI